MLVSLGVLVALWPVQGKQEKWGWGWGHRTVIRTHNLRTEGKTQSKCVGEEYSIGSWNFTPYTFLYHLCLHLSICLSRIHLCMVCPTITMQISIHPYAHECITHSLFIMYPSIHSSFIHPSIHPLSILLSTIHVCLHPCIIHPSFNLSIHPSFIHSSFYTYKYTPFHPSIHPSPFIHHSLGTSNA